MTIISEGTLKGLTDELDATVLRVLLIIVKATI